MKGARAAIPIFALRKSTVGRPRPSVAESLGYGGVPDPLDKSLASEDVPPSTACERIKSKRRSIAACLPRLPGLAMRLRQKNMVLESKRHTLPGPARTTKTSFIPHPALVLAVRSCIQLCAVARSLAPTLAKAKASRTPPYPTTPKFPHTFRQSLSPHGSSKGKNQLLL